MNTLMLEKIEQALEVKLTVKQQFDLNDYLEYEIDKIKKEAYEDGWEDSGEKLREDIINDFRRSRWV